MSITVTETDTPQVATSANENGYVKLKPENSGVKREPLEAAPKSYKLPEKDLFGPVTLARGYRSLFVYLSLLLGGTVLWVNPTSAKYNVLGAGLMFPGGGFLALGGWWVLLFPLVPPLFLAAVFLWRLVGNLLLPPTVYIGSAVLASYLARPRQASTLLSATPYVLWVLAVSALEWWINGIRRMGIDMEEVRVQRNTYIDRQVAIEEAATAAAISSIGNKPGERELSPEQIESMRYLINLTRQPLDSWKGFTHIDQFRESALRYQLYHIGYGLGIIQCNITPNFHGELSRAHRSAIERVLEPAVLYYWIWESIWGRFSLKWDPVEKENVMITGWYILSLMMYTANTRDQRYMEPKSLVFRVTSWLKYSHSIPSLIQALTNNMNDSPFCLYACEPNWIYSICNLYGMTGTIIYDRMFGTDTVKKILPRFTKAWESEFMNRDGLFVPVRSSLIGLQLPVGGMTVFAGVAYQCRPLLRKIADQLWAITKADFIERDDKGKISKLKLTGTDYIDPGSYGYSEECIASKACITMAATERGDSELAEFCEKSIRASATTASDGCGGTYIKELSGLSNIFLATEIFSGPDDFNNTVNVGPPEHTFQGPLLAEAPYPQVVVAKAWSHYGKDMDVVLYPGTTRGRETVTLSLERLKIGQKYSMTVKDEMTHVFGDKDGNTRVGVTVEGRTSIYLNLSV